VPFASISPANFSPSFPRRSLRSVADVQQRRARLGTIERNPGKPATRHIRAWLQNSARRRRRALRTRLAKSGVRILRREGWCFQEGGRGATIRSGRAPSAVALGVCLAPDIRCLVEGWVAGLAPSAGAWAVGRTGQRRRERGLILWALQA
jgi:hypothetical protein